MNFVKLYERTFKRAARDRVTIAGADGTSTGVHVKFTREGVGDLDGAVERARFEMLALAADCTVEPRKGDTVTMTDGKSYEVEHADPHRRAAGGVVLAYHLELSE